jgi:TolB-like protein
VDVNDACSQAPDEAAVRGQLAALLNTASMQRAPQLSALLTFLVDETLAGRGGDLKEYVIGTRALGRADGFDPDHDPIVRVQVRQLRRRLAEYYEQEGCPAPVRISIPKGAYAAAFAAIPPPTPPPPPVPLLVRTWRSTVVRHLLAGVAGLAIAVVALTVWQAGPVRPGNGMPAQPMASVAVLPFLNLTGRADEEYFSDGMTEELITSLSRVEALTVIARTSAFAYKGRTGDVRKIARELGVDHVVEGSVRREAGRVRIGVRLTRASDAASLWSESYDRELRDALTLQREIAGRVAAVLSARVALEIPGGDGSPSATAQDLYLRGRYLWNRRTSEALALATGLFQEAIAREPRFAQAHAALAATYAVMEFNGVTPPGQSRPLARAAADRALSIDPRSPMALAVLAGLLSGGDYDWAESNARFEEAIAIQPADATLRHWYGTNLVYLGRFDDGLRELQRAQQLDPLSMPIAYSLGEAYLYARRYDRVLEQAAAMRAADPTYAGAFDLQSRAYAMLGRWDDALGAADRCLHFRLNRAVVLARAGRTAEARQLASALEQTDLAVRMPYSIAAIYAAAGDADTAFLWLNRAQAQHQSQLVAVAVDPSFDRLRADGRYVRLTRALRLDPARSIRDVAHRDRGGATP